MRETLKRGGILSGREWKEGSLGRRDIVREDLENENSLWLWHEAVGSLPHHFEGA
jgi:hypothetical protein